MSLLVPRGDIVRLDHPKDMIRWEPEFKSKAISLDLWDYVNPEGKIPWPTKPREPQLSDYPKKPVRTTDRAGVETRSSSSSTQTETITPAPEEINNGGIARTIAELTAEGKENYKFETSTFMHKEKQYAIHRSNYDKFLDWIKSTVSPAIRTTCCDVNKTPDEWFINLKALGRPYEYTKKDDITEKYRQMMLKPLTKTPRPFDKWIQEWETMMAHGQEYGCADTTDASRWTKDLANTLRTIMPTWADTFRDLNQTEIDNNTLNFRIVASKLLERSSSMNQGTVRRNVEKGAFPTFGEVSDEDNSSEKDQEKPRRENNAQKSRGKGKKRADPKRKRADTTEGPVRTKCRACLGFHRLSECFYALPEIAPEGWKARDNVQEMVEERIKNDTGLEEEIKNLRLNKGERPSK